jgi:hypothetical protein
MPSNSIHGTTGTQDKVVIQDLNLYTVYMTVNCKYYVINIITEASTFILG